MTGLSSSTIVSTNLGLFFISDALTGLRAHCGTDMQRICASCHDVLPVVSAALLEITLLDGTVLHCANDQLVRAKSADREDWIPAAKLKVQDQIAVSIGVPACQCTKIKQPDPNLIKLLALMADQGHEFVTKEVARFNEFSAAYLAFFGYPIQGNNNKKMLCGVVGPSALDTLTDYGLGDLNSLPRAVLQAPPDLIQLYLDLARGPFPPKIAQQVKLLWQRLGYQCKIDEQGVHPVKKIGNGTLWSPIHDISRYRKDAVYRLSVNGNRSFSANGISVRAI